MNVKCISEDEFEFTRRIMSNCDLEFEHDSDKIYQINYVNYFGEDEEQFYTMCPRCGRIILIDEKELTQDEKEVARNKTKEDIFLYEKNNILSEYVNICNRSTKVRKKTL